MKKIGMIFSLICILAIILIAKHHFNSQNSKTLKVQTPDSSEVSNQISEKSQMLIKSLERSNIQLNLKDKNYKFSSDDNDQPVLTYEQIENKVAELSQDEIRDLLRFTENKISTLLHEAKLYDNLEMRNEFIFYTRLKSVIKKNQLMQKINKLSEGV